jgi:hypothetical protein
VQRRRRSGSYPDSVTPVSLIAQSDSSLWIGGSPCSGKSTVAQRLAAADGWSLYSCDDHWDDHVARATRDRLPVLTKVGSLAADVRLRQPIDVQVADVFEAYREEFALIRADLADVAMPVIVEGAALLPELLATMGVPADRAVWMVPTEAFQRAYYARRPWARDLLAGTPDADDLFDAWMRRDAAFAGLVARHAEDLEYQVVWVDGSVSVEAVTGRIRRLLRP